MDYISPNVAKRNPLADNGFTMPKKQQKNLNLIPEVRAAYDAEVKKLERYTEREIVSGALALWLMVPEDARIAAVALVRKYGNRSKYERNVADSFKRVAGILPEPDPQEQSVEVARIVGATVAEAKLLGVDAPAPPETASQNPRSKRKSAQ